MKRKDPKSLRMAGSHADAAYLATMFPNLAEFLTAATWDGSEEMRAAPTLTLWASAGQWKLSMKDRAEGLVLWLSSEKLLELIQLAELYCLEPEGPWRVDDQQSASNGKRVQKRS